MSTHLERHRAEMEKLAYPAVREFITQHPGYSIDPDQRGSDSNTNYVIFGQRGQEPIVFKYFCEDERTAREIYALRHFAQTGLVPRLLAVEGKRLIVQSRIPGGWLPNPDDPAYHSIDPKCAGFTLGQAVATLVAVPLSAQAASDYESRFYDSLSLEKYFSIILDASWLIHRHVGAYLTPLFADSLASIEANLPYILGQQRLLYHQDAMNMHFVGSNFAGFFDLELCRVGTEAMQIGSLWHFFATHNNWHDFSRGFASISDHILAERDFAAAQAFAHFLVWRYISRYGRWRADPADTASRHNAEADTAQYTAAITRNNKIRPGN